MLINTLCIFGTRPEAIKMAPLINELNANPNFCNTVGVTGQHQAMLSSVLNLFNIQPHFNLQVMEKNQDLCGLTAKILTGLSTIFTQYKPHLVFLHGDTTTTLAASLSAYYHRIPTAHVEAGLRSGNIFLPWPEEANRKLSGALASIHFAPTRAAKNNLLQEGVPVSQIHVTGNRVIDALQITIKKIDSDAGLQEKLRCEFSYLNRSRKLILVTGHRRENFGHGLELICQAIAQIARNFTDVDIVYPVHLNPNVQVPVKTLLGSIPNVYLIDPIDYISFVYLMRSSFFILTDSGGIQEEAPSIGKPVLLMRDNTERPEAIESGAVKLVGTDVAKIVHFAEQLLNNEWLYQQMSTSKNLYGDGHAAARIIQATERFFGLSSSLSKNENLVHVNSIE